MRAELHAVIITGVRRDLAIDIAKGCAILSMITGHFAAGEVVAKPAHLVPDFDGASAFVLLSGLLLGIVHRRKIDSTGTFQASRASMIRRVAVIYSCQLTISLAAFSVLVLGFPNITGLGHPSSWAQIFFLRYVPPGGDVLSLYFILMILAIMLLPLIQRGFGKWVIVASFALYIYALIAPYALWNYWASWQILFVPAIVVGWSWSEQNIAAILEKRALTLMILSVSIAITSVYLNSVSVGGLREILSDKVTLGPSRVVAAWVIVPTIYVIVQILLRRVPSKWFRPLSMAGARSLDSYVLQALLLIALPLLINLPWGTLEKTMSALGTFLVCWAWSEARRALNIHKLHRLPSAVWVSLTPSRAS